MAAACLLLLAPVTALAQGAAETGVYRNRLAEGPAPRSAADIDARLNRYWQSLFAGDDASRVYYQSAANADGPTAYILDTGNADVRSEGISYGLMIAVQMDHKAEFDALWNWTYTHMRYASGPLKGYFRWQCTPQAVTRTDRLQAFFASQGLDTYANQYSLDGTPLSADRSTALIAANGVTSLIATGPHAQNFVDALWALEPPTGKWRYYNGMLQFMSLLHVSGRFRVY